MRFASKVFISLPQTPSLLSKIHSNRFLSSLSGRSSGSRNGISGSSLELEIVRRPIVPPLRFNAITTTFIREKSQVVANATSNHRKPANRVKALISVDSKTIEGVIEAYKRTGSTQGDLEAVLHSSKPGTQLAFPVANLSTKQRLVIKETLEHAGFNPKLFVIASSKDADAPSLDTILNAKTCIQNSEDVSKTFLDMLALSRKGEPIGLDKDLETPLPPGFIMGTRKQIKIQAAIEIKSSGNVHKQARYIEKLGAFLREMEYEAMVVVSATVPEKSLTTQELDNTIKNAKKSVEKSLEAERLLEYGPKN